MSGLSEMSLQELWRLFPIILTAPDFERWKTQYLEEESVLRQILSGAPNTEIHHIGSTAVGTIWSKPTVDILVVSGCDSLETIKNALLNNGYLLMSQSEKRISFNKGYTEKGFAEKVFHIHVRFKGDVDELYFRDYLIAHHDIAQKYEKLKLSLMEKYVHDRDSYTDSKTDFVKFYTALAKKEFLAKY